MTGSIITLIIHGTFLHIIFRKEIRHLGKNKRIYSKIEIGRKQSFFRTCNHVAYANLMTHELKKSVVSAFFEIESAFLDI